MRTLGEERLLAPETVGLIRENARAMSRRWDLLPARDQTLAGALAVTVLCLGVASVLVWPPHSMLELPSWARWSAVAALAALGPALHCVVRLAAVSYQAFDNPWVPEPPEIRESAIVVEGIFDRRPAIDLREPFGVTEAPARFPFRQVSWPVRQRGRRVVLTRRVRGVKEIVIAALGPEAWTDGPRIDEAAMARWQGRPEDPALHLATSLRVLAFGLATILVGLIASPLVGVIVAGVAAALGVRRLRHASHLERDALVARDDTRIDLTKPWTLARVTPGPGADGVLAMRQGATRIHFLTAMPGAARLVEHVGGIDAIEAGTLSALEQWWEGRKAREEAAAAAAHRHAEVLLQRDWAGAPAGPRHGWTATALIVVGLLVGGWLVLSRMPLLIVLFLMFAPFAAPLVHLLGVAWRATTKRPRLEGDHLVGSRGRRIDLRRPWALRIVGQAGPGQYALFEAEQDGVRLRFDSQMWGAEALVRNARGLDAWTKAIAA